MYEWKCNDKIPLSFCFNTLVTSFYLWKQSNLAQCHCDSAGNGLSPFVVTV